jgi:hypothetical protein
MLQTQQIVAELVKEIIDKIAPTPFKNKKVKFDPVPIIFESPKMSLDILVKKIQIFDEQKIMVKLEVRNNTKHEGDSLSKQKEIVEEN